MTTTGACRFLAVPRGHHSEERLEVDLFVCPEPDCRQVGKRPITDVGGTVKGFCKGPLKAPHKKRRMVPVRFVEAGE